LPGMLVALLAVAAAPEHHPAFFWSPQSYEGLKGSVQHLAEATGADLEATVGALCGAANPIEGGSRPLFEGRLASGSKAPEVALVFLANGLQTDAVRKGGADLKSVKTLMDSAASALTVPFTLPSAELPLFSDAPRVAASEAEAYFQRNAKLFHNGVPDVVVVELESVGGDRSILAAHDELINRVSAAVNEGTRGEYAALLTAGFGPRGAHRMLQSSAASVAYLHTTPTLLTAQLVMLILIVIFLAGFCCLFSLQTPKKFDEVKQAAQQ